MSRGPSPAAAAKAEALIEDIEWLVKFHQCEYAILTAVGYADRPKSLKTQLMRLGRHDLVPKIFEWDRANSNHRYLEGVK